MFLFHLDPELRAAALRAFSHLHYVPAHREEDVIAHLQDVVWFVRVQAAHACVGIANDEVHNHLWAVLGDPKWWVRHSAADCLAKRGSKGREVLEMAVKFHPDPFARDISLQTLV
jgi:HEAT repeat protein